MQRSWMAVRDWACSSRSFFPMQSPPCYNSNSVVPQCLERIPLPMIVINDYDKLTLTVGLKYLKEWDPNWAVLLAGATISIVPIVIVFLLFQKYFMASAMNSGFGGK
mgnify:CR=1 FL=1